MKFMKKPRRVNVAPGLLWLLVPPAITAALLWYLNPGVFP